jgi:SAM-dependent methyltransferase
MTLPPNFADLVFQYDPALLREWTGCLQTHGYGRIQYSPALNSRLAVFKEPANLANFFTRKRHLLFYYSAFPRLYQQLLTLGSPALSLSYRFCNLNEPVPLGTASDLFSSQLVKASVQNGILLQTGDSVRFSLRFIPYGDLTIVSDPYCTYPPYTNGKAKFPQRVWIGADSIIFSTFLDQALRGAAFRNALEIGSGSGLATLRAARVSQSCVAVDVNPRAVRFTQLNAAINGFESAIEARRSDLYEAVPGVFDLIVANPWYCDLETGGLEEVPGIVAGLDAHLAEGGVCVMLLNSYVKNGVDCVHEYLKRFIESSRYDMVRHIIGSNIDRSRLADLERHGISHSVYFTAVLRKSGSGRIECLQPPVFRRVRDLAYIAACRLAAR